MQVDVLKMRCVKYSQSLMEDMRWLEGVVFCRCRQWLWHFQLKLCALLVPVNMMDAGDLEQRVIFPGAETAQTFEGGSWLVLQTLTGRLGLREKQTQVLGVCTCVKEGHSSFQILCAVTVCLASVSMREVYWHRVLTEKVHGTLGNTS